MYETIVDNLVWPLVVLGIAGLFGIWWKWLRKKQGHDDTVNVNLEGLSLGSYDPAADAPDEVKRKANEILELARHESARGHVMYAPHSCGVDFKVGKFETEITDAKEQAVVKGAIELLVDRNDLDEQNENVFLLTAKGYQSKSIG